MEIGKNTKFQHSIPKMTPARPKKTGTWGVNSPVINQNSFAILMLGYF